MCNALVIVDTSARINDSVNIARRKISTYSFKNSNHTFQQLFSAYSLLTFLRTHGEEQIWILASVFRME